MAVSILSQKGEKKMTEIKFTWQEKVNGESCIDLKEYGYFNAEAILFNEENQNWFKVRGSLITCPKGQNVAIIFDDIELFVELLSCFNLKNLTAGEIISLPWLTWHTESIPKEWEY